MQIAKVAAGEQVVGSRQDAAQADNAAAERAIAEQRM